MPIQPDTLKLLEAVSNSLAERVAPSLSGAERYEALMAISAIRTVLREIADSEHRADSEKNRLLALLKGEQTPDDKTWGDLEQELGSAIRAGAFTEEQATRELLSYLRASCHSTLQVTNPKVAADYKLTTR